MPVKTRLGYVGGPLVAAALALSCALPASAQLLADEGAAATGTLGSFTPSGKRAATDTQAAERSFSFTPAGKARKGVSVGVTSRVVRDAAKPAPAEVSALRSRAPQTPRELEAKVDVGFRGFSLSGGVKRETGPAALVQRESVEAGMSYSAKRWRAAIAAGQSAAADTNRIVPGQVGDAEHVELEGGYRLTDGLAVRGGVRYERLHPEAYGRDFVNRDADKAAESGTVYLGTSISF